MIKANRYLLLTVICIDDLKSAALLDTISGLPLVVLATKQDTINIHPKQCEVNIIDFQRFNGQQLLYNLFVPISKCSDSPDLIDRNLWEEFSKLFHYNTYMIRMIAGSLSTENRNTGTVNDWLRAAIEDINQVVISLGSENRSDHFLFWMQRKISELSPVQLDVFLSAAHCERTFFDHPTEGASIWKAKFKGQYSLYRKQCVFYSLSDIKKDEATRVLEQLQKQQLILSFEARDYVALVHMHDLQNACAKKYCLEKEIDVKLKQKYGNLLELAAVTEEYDMHSYHSVLEAVLSPPSDKGRQLKLAHMRLGLDFDWLKANHGSWETYFKHLFRPTHTNPLEASFFTI